MKAMPIQPAQNPSRNQLERLLRIHDFLNAAWRDELPMRGAERMRTNCSQLALELEVSRKTIQRDLDYMKDHLRLDIEYDPSEKQFAYRYEQPRFPLGHDLTYDERVALIVARQSLEIFSGVGFGNEIRHALDKLTGGMLGECGPLLHDKLERYISVRVPGAGRIDEPKVFHCVYKAVLNQLELRIEYQARGRSSYTQRRLHPYHLACVENRWILVARDVEKDCMRTFVLARFRNPLVTKKDFKRPDNFDPESYLGTSFGSWTGTGNILVELMIGPEAAHHVREREWHKTQRIEPQPRGFVKATFSLSDLHDVTRWILSFGSEVVVLQPKELREAVSEEARKMATANADLA
jgi:proteasome accessory factor B